MKGWLFSLHSFSARTSFLFHPISHIAYEMLSTEVPLYVRRQSEDIVVSRSLERGKEKETVFFLLFPAHSSFK